MSTQDQKLFNLVQVVIGCLIGVTVFLVFLARNAGNDNQRVWAAEDPSYAAAVDSRIAPAGHVALPGDEPATDSPASVTTAAATPASAKLTGEQVYNAECFACHGAGIGGAPKFADAGAWKPRLAQGTNTLHSHALAGYQGQAGFMPPKGGRVDLSDEEIISAVDFMAAAGR